MSRAFPDCLEILRDKGAITGEEYKKALEEAHGQEKKTVNEAMAEARKENKISSWLEKISSDTTVILVEDDADLLLEIADQVLVLADGHLY